jgi:predicted dithiol-disulfide oxidoreductase (DUF899 family)
MEHLQYPNESEAYRAARNALLDEEIKLRAQIEAVAEKRRALPMGGEVPQDYVFERIGKTIMPEKVRMSELFGPHDTLILYSFMYGPERDEPCSGCTHLLDGIDGAARHLGQRAAFHVVAKSPIARLAAWAHTRGWEHMSLISTAGNAYDADYFGDTSKFSKGMRAQHKVPDGENWDETIFNVFRKREWKNPSLLGLGDELRAAGAEPASSRRRSCRPLVESSRHDAGGARGQLVSEGGVLGELEVIGRRIMVSVALKPRRSRSSTASRLLARSGRVQSVS